MQFGRTGRTILIGSKFAHYVEHLQCSHALPVRRKLIDGPAAIGGRNGLNPLRREISQVFKPHGSAEGRGSIYDGLCDLSFVKSVTTLLGDETQGLRQVRIAKVFAELRSSAARKKHTRGFRIFLQQV